MAVVAALTGVTLLVGGGIRADPVEEHLPEQVPQPVQPASRVVARRWSGPVRMGMRNGAWCVGCSWALIWRSITRHRRDEHSVPQGMDKRNADDLRREIGQPPLGVRIPVVGVRYLVCGGAGWGLGGRCRRRRSPPPASR